MRLTLRTEMDGSGGDNVEADGPERLTRPLAKELYSRMSMCGFGLGSCGQAGDHNTTESLIVALEDEDEDVRAREATAIVDGTGGRGKNQERAVQTTMQNADSE